MQRCQAARCKHCRTLDNDLSVALLALQQGEPKLDALAMERLKSAEEAMLRFLAEQYDDSGSEEHQSERALFGFSGGLWSIENA